LFSFIVHETPHNVHVNRKFVYRLQLQTTKTTTATTPTHVKGWKNGFLAWKIPKSLLIRIRPKWGKSRNG